MRRSPHFVDEAKARAITWLTAWDSQGVHRTETDGDEAGARWLADEAAGLGVEVASEVFTLDRLEPVACYLELDGELISGVPVFDAPVTRADGLTGTLTLSGQADGILVAQPSPRSVYTREYENLRRSTAHRALVIVCADERPGLGLLNAERFRNPYGAPAIHVSSEASEAVLSAAGRQTCPGRLGKPICPGLSPQRGCLDPRIPPLLHPSGRDDAAQLVVAVDCGARWRPRLLARNITRACRGFTRRRCDLHRQQWS